MSKDECEIKMQTPIWQTQFGDGPLVAAAIHDGHAVRDELVERFALDENGRLREEDPFTGLWTAAAPTRIVGMRSRFEIDLNRPREKAVYLRPEDAWGLNVWKEPLSEETVARSLAEWDDFYDHVGGLLTRLAARHRHVVVFDLHGYNHRRAGADAPEDDPRANPQVNIGTGTMNRQRWAPIVERCIEALRQFDYQGGRLDVRENVKFRGGHFPGWIHQQFPDRVCAVAIELKKFFMDEWTGHPHQDHLYAIGQALQSAAGAVGEELQRLE